MNTINENIIDIKKIKNLLSQNNSKVYCAFFDATTKNLVNPALDNAINVSDKYCFEGIENFAQGFIFSSDIFIFIHRNRTVGNVSASKSYNDFLMMLDEMKKAKSI